MTNDQNFRARQLRYEFDARQQRIDAITSGSVVSACQHRVATQMQQENRRIQAKLNELEGRKPEPFKEPSFVMTEAQATRLEGLIARLPASDKNAVLAKEVLGRSKRIVTGREAYLLGIGR